MARPKNSPEKISNMRNAMMDAVVELLDEVPPEKVSIRMIAEKIGVSHMVFYTYFKDRAEVMEALIERQQSRIDDHFKGLFAEAQSKKVKDVLNGVFREYAKTAHDHPKIFRLFWLIPEGETGKKLDTIKHLDPTINKLADLLKLGMDRGEFVKKEPRLAAMAVLTLINSPLILNECAKMPKDLPCEKLLNEIIQAVFAYLSK